MQPASIPLSIVQGATLRESLRVMQSQFEYRPLSAISATAPVQLTVAHDLPKDWPVWLQGVQGLQELNRASNQTPLFASVIDADHLEINSVSAAGRNAVGGMLVYHPPVDLTGASALLRVTDEQGGVLLEFAPTVHAGGWIDINMTAEQTAELTWRKGTWLLDATLPNGDVARLFTGPASVSELGAAPATCGTWPSWVYTFGTQGPPGAGGAGGGAGGLVSFNGRTAPAVVLSGSDVTTALGYMPVNPSALAGVAFTGSYVGLTDKPFIPATYGDVGAASAAQGVKADNAATAESVVAGLALKVDKVPGYGLSKNDLTDARAAKLDAMPDDHFKGIHVSEAALAAALPAAAAGDYADVDAGVGADSVRYVWDVSDSKWIKGGASASMTAAQVLALYESNPNRNAFTDALKAKLDGVAAGATANPDTDSLPESGAPTNKWFTESRALDTVLTGLSLADAAAVAATDSMRAAFGKVQRQVNDIKQSITDLVGTVASNLAFSINRANHTGAQGVQTILGSAAGMRFASQGAAVMGTRSAVSPFIPATGGNQPIGIYDVVRVKAGYEGPCMRIRRSSDNLETDIGFAADGIVDTNAIFAWKNATAAANPYIYVTTIYNQAGGSDHLTQTVLANMPQLDLVYLRNGMPGVFSSSARWLDIPAGIAIASTKDCSVFAAFGNWSSVQAGTPWSLGIAGAFELGLTPGTSYSVTPRVGATASPVAAATALQFVEGLATLPNSNGCVVGLTSLATEMRYFVNNRQYTRAALTTAQNLAVSGGKWCPGGPMDMYGLLIYGTGQTRADCMAIQAAMSYAHRCVFEVKAQLALVGDSLTASAVDYMHNYNKELWNYFGLSVAIFNIGLGGQTLAQQASQVATRVVGLFKANMQNIAVNLGGVNDITGGATAAATYASAVAWHAPLKAAGWQTIQGLLFARAVTGSYTSAMQAERIALNNLIRANTGVGKDLGPLLADFELEPLNLPTILTPRFSGDNLHWNQTGYVLQTPYIAAPVYTLMGAA